jgi:hypothetical protein
MPTEENTSQSRMPPAQDGQGVSQGLADVRRKVSMPDIRGRSRMPQFRSYGSVRGAVNDGRPYRDRVLRGVRMVK